jgi:pimeloyl-ACP methyl ester carboxylesterase
MRVASRVASPRPSPTRTRFFTQELPALWQTGTFTEAEARRITQPVLAVQGEHSAPTFPE